MRRLLPSTRVDSQLIKRGIHNIITTTNSQATLKHDLKYLFSRPPINNSKIELEGWIKSVRILKKMAFVDLSDGTIEKSIMLVMKNPEEAKSLKTGQSIKIKGNWEKSVKNQEYEIKIDNLEIIGNVEDNYPLQKKFHSKEFIRSLPILKFNTNTLSSVMRTRSFLDYKLNDFFSKEGFIKTNPPLITSSDCEGAGELFNIESNSSLDKQNDNSNFFFNKKTYLTVSTQLHLEILAQSLNKVWTLSPCFRAEESDTNRHLSEFWMLEAEISFINDVNQLTNFSEKMLKYLIKSILNNENGSLDNLIKNKRTKEDLVEIENRLKILENFGKNWYQITYHEAIKLLQESTKKDWVHLPPILGNSLSTEHEKYLTDEIFKSPVFVINYPKDEKAFYMKSNNDIENTVACYDLLFPVMGELIGGSLRESSYEILLNEVKRRKMKVEDIEWYLNLRKNGSVPHGGFGMGFERLVMYLCNLDNIKDAIMLSRSVGNCQC